MAFPDPITWTSTVLINDDTLTRVESGRTDSVYESGTGNIICRISHLPAKDDKIRSLIRFDRIEHASDEDPDGVEFPNGIKSSFYMVLERPRSATAKISAAELMSYATEAIGLISGFQSQFVAKEH